MRLLVPYGRFEDVIDRNLVTIDIQYSRTGVGGEEHALVEEIS